ncbi:ABC transporter substrate-binding protein [Pleionea sediminis]|uniref:ABC transporter substrate-binding protein n=1 Tax=Pleionea sediminis TaxID=2569479 RepID=UPI001186DC9D|nr:ABC transporter substrate binding protein [Pleionea sediminis]
MQIKTITFKSLVLFFIAIITALSHARQDDVNVPKVVFVLDNQTGNYLPILKGFREYSRKHVGRLIRIDMVNNDNQTPAFISEQLAGDYDVVVTLGEKSTRDVLRTHTNLPIFALKVDQSVLRALNKSAHSKAKLVTGIFRDQPFSRYAALIQQSMPKYKRVGILLSQKTKTLKPQFDEVMRQYNLTPVVNIVRENDLPQRVLERLAQKSDVIIAIFDDNIYSQTNIKSHLLTAFRHQIPVIGVTRNYTEIGAIASLYTDNFELGQQAAKHILKMVDEKIDDMPPLYPESFALRLNYNVMRSFDLSDIDQTQLRKIIKTTTEGNE